MATDTSERRLAHWIVIGNEKIANYQCVVPSDWNAGPRDPDASPAPTRRRSPATPSTIPSSRSKCCAPSTASTRASPARCISPAKKARGSRLRWFERCDSSG